MFGLKIVKSETLKKHFDEVSKLRAEIAKLKEQLSSEKENAKKIILENASIRKTIETLKAEINKENTETEVKKVEEKKPRARRTATIRRSSKKTVNSVVTEPVSEK